MLSVVRPSPSSSRMGWRNKKSNLISTPRTKQKPKNDKLNSLLSSNSGIESRDPSRPLVSSFFFLCGLFFPARKSNLRALMQFKTLIRWFIAAATVHVCILLVYFCARAPYPSLEIYFSLGHLELMECARLSFSRALPIAFGRNVQNLHLVINMYMWQISHRQPSSRRTKGKWRKYHRHTNPREEEMGTQIISERNDVDIHEKKHNNTERKQQETQQLPELLNTRLMSFGCSAALVKWNSSFLFMLGFFFPPISASL